MIATRPLLKRSSFWITAILLGFLILLIYYFRNEVCAILTNRACGPQDASIANRSAGLRVLIQLGFVFIGGLLGSLFLISQFVLPVRTLRERFLVFIRLGLYLVRLHGPAIFVREGKQKAKTRELESSRPGVAFVDPSSAIVLEKQWKPRRQAVSSGPITNFIRRRLLHQPEKIYVAPPLVRAGGPGIVFTRFSERIIGIADLRRQFRMNMNVSAYTADGLEVSAHVFTIFSLGLPSEVLKVAYIGEEKPENLRILQIERKPWTILKENTQGDAEKDESEDEKTQGEAKKKKKEKYLGKSVEKIIRINDSLDPDDRSKQRNQILIDRGEVHRYAQTKAELYQFLVDLTPLSRDILNKFIDELNPRGKETIKHFIWVLYNHRRAILKRIFDKLMPIDIPEVGIYRFALNRTILHQIIDEFENYLISSERKKYRLSRSEKRTLHRFINQLFGKYKSQTNDFYQSLNQQTGSDIQAKIQEFRQKYWMNKEHPKPPKPDNIPQFLSPFGFYPDRVFHAIYARGRNFKAGVATGPDNWTELPTQIATELFRQELSLIKYDQLYEPEKPSSDFPLVKTIKPRFGQIMRHTGVLAFQFIRRRDGKLLEERELVGEILDPNIFNLDYPAMEFRQPKSLRERGIRVFASSFTELKPVAMVKKDEPASQEDYPVVRNQRFDAWQAQWQKESEYIKAESELELMHIRSRARAQAQQEMSIALSQILESPNYSQEAMAMRVFQALESAATDPSTHQLLPGQTIDMLRSLRHWLLPSEVEKDESLFEGEWFESDEELPPEDQNLINL